MSVFVWTDATGAGRNVYALFRRVITVTGAIKQAELRLFADARYRLRINGRIVAYGPGRFVQAHPMADRHDLRDHLQDGVNIIVVEAQNPGSRTFQTTPQSRAAFWAAGTITSSAGSHDLATPGAWDARTTTAWDTTAPAFSFAQGPVEICDLAALPDALFEDPALPGWQPALPLSDPSTWGALEERSIPALSGRLDAPAQLLLQADLDDSEDFVSCRCYIPEWASATSVQTRDRRAPYAVCIWSPQAQRVAAGLFWGPHWLNGQPLAQRKHPSYGNREQADLILQTGWNLLYGEPTVMAQSWAATLAVPRAAGLLLRATPNAHATAVIRHAEACPPGQAPGETGHVPRSASDLDQLGLRWQFVEAAAARQAPARECAWDRPAAIQRRDATPAFPYQLCADRGTVFVWDLGREFLGHVQIDLDAPAGTVIDVAADERRRDDGLLALFESNPFAEGVDRYRHAGGRATIEAFHPHGGRYLQIHLRPPAGATGILTLHGVAVRSAQVPVARDGRFACADPIFDWTWSAAYQTLQACVEDAFLDCPWRERGTYLGDALMEAGSLRSFSRDQAITERCIALWAQGQQDDGQMTCAVPTCHVHQLNDFTLIWPLLLHDHWRHHADLALVERWFPVIPRILASPAWQEDAVGLWTANDLHCFIDWGCANAAKTGDRHACLNALRIQTLRCAAALATALQRTDEAAGYEREAMRVEAAFQTHLWNDEAGHFEAGFQNGVAIDDPALHGNVLALAFGLCRADQAPRVLAHIEAGLIDNVRRGIDGGNGAGHLELYFLGYALPALYAQGRADLAESVIREHYGLMMHHGAWTLWEHFGVGVRGQGSLCHAWANAPVIAFREWTLGVRPLVDGDPSRLLIAPDSHLAWAAGVVPHQAGDIHVAWQREGTRLHLRYRLPPGVRAEIRPGPAFADCRVVIEQEPTA